MAVFFSMLCVFTFIAISFSLNIVPKHDGRTENKTTIVDVTLNQATSLAWKIKLDEKRNETLSYINISRKDSLTNEWTILYSKCFNSTHSNVSGYTVPERLTSIANFYDAKMYKNKNSVTILNFTIYNVSMRVPFQHLRVTVGARTHTTTPLDQSMKGIPSSNQSTTADEVRLNILEKARYCDGNMTNIYALVYKNAPTKLKIDVCGNPPPTMTWSIDGSDVTGDRNIIASITKEPIQCTYSNLNIGMSESYTKIRYTILLNSKNEQLCGKTITHTLIGYQQSTVSKKATITMTNTKPTITDVVASKPSDGCMFLQWKISPIGLCKFNTYTIQFFDKYDGLLSRQDFETSKDKGNTFVVCSNVTEMKHLQLTVHDTDNKTSTTTEKLEISNLISTTKVITKAKDQKWKIIAIVFIVFFILIAMGVACFLVTRRYCDVKDEEGDKTLILRRLTTKNNNEGLEEQTTYDIPVNVKNNDKQLPDSAVKKETVHNTYSLQHDVTNENPTKGMFTRTKQQSTNSRTQENIVYENNAAMADNKALTKVRQPRPVPIPKQKLSAPKQNVTGLPATDEQPRAGDIYENMSSNNQKQQREKTEEETFYEVPPTG